MPDINGMVKALKHFLGTKCIGDAVYEINEALIKSEVSKAKCMLEMYEKMLVDAENLSRQKTDKDVEFAQESSLDKNAKFADYEDIYPCMVCIINASGSVFVLNCDGSYEVTANIKQAGNVFVGLGSLISRSKSYKELMSKAEQGDMRSVHEFTSDLSQGSDVQTDDKGNMYGTINDMAVESDQPEFLFGKCVFQNLGSFKHEDLARSLFYYCMSNIVQTTHTACRIFSKVRHCFFVGDMTKYAFARDMMFKEWMEREIEISFHTDMATHHIHFLKHEAFREFAGKHTDNTSDQ